jgi:anti-anti-sigma regulatory factor
MLRIMVEARDGGSVVRAEGQMIGAWVDELRRSLEEATRAGMTVTVDLAGVSFVDRRGVDLLRALAHRGVAVVNCSGFVAEQLKG